MFAYSYTHNPMQAYFCTVYLRCLPSIFTYLYAHIPLHVHILPHPHLYLQVYIFQQPYTCECLLIFTSVHACLQNSTHVFLCITYTRIAFAYLLTSTRMAMHVYILLSSYTYTCLHSSRSVYFFMRKYLLTRIPILSMCTYFLIRICMQDLLLLKIST
jgi:hypothetical protein